MRNARTVVSLVALAFLTTACGAETVTDTATVPDPTTSRPSPASAAAGTAIPEILEFEAPLLDGGVLRGADYAGKDVAFWFWAPW